MKKVIFVIVLCILCGTIVYLNIYKNKEVSTINDFIVETLNGKDLSYFEVNEVVKAWGKKYQEDNFVSDDSLYCLLDNVSEFESVKSALEAEKKYYLENPDAGFSIENVFDYSKYGVSEELYNKYSAKYSEKDENDNRVIVKDNGYYIYYNDINFDDVLEYDEIFINHYHTFIQKSDLDFKETYTQRQLKNRFQMIGYDKNGSDIVYRVFDNEENKAVQIRVSFDTIFVSKIQIQK